MTASLIHVNIRSMNSNSEKLQLYQNNKNLFVSDGNNECVPVEIEKKNSKDLLITCCYRPPSGAIKGLNSYLENVFKKANTENVLQ